MGTALSSIQSTKMIRQIFILAATAAVILVNGQQEDPVCECGMFVQQSKGTPQQHGPIIIHADTPPVNCVGYDDINCKHWCAEEYVRVMRDWDWSEDHPDTGKPLGDSFCDGLYDTADVNYPQCTEPFVNAQYRLYGCDVGSGPPPGSNDGWQDVGLIEDEQQQFCCNQLGAYVHNCPPDATLV